jgi:dipeptidyl aminopeptidase/acylaminoacyl peptidase
MRKSRWHGLVVLLVLGLSHPARADQPGVRPTLDQRLDALFRVRIFKEVALAPDCRWLAWVEELPVKDPVAPPGAAVYVLDLQAQAGSPRRLSAGDGQATHDEHGLAWAPDSRRLAFLSDREKAGQLQLYLADPANGATRKLTSVTGHLATPGFSPDGKTLAILFTENATRATGPTQPATVEVGVIGEQVYEQRLSLVDAATGRLRPLSPADLYVYEYDWAPDGRHLVAVAAPGDGDNNWYIARLLTLAVASDEARTLLQPTMQIAVPRWSPDGRTIAFIGGLMSDEGANGGDIYTIPAQGGPPRNLTPDLKASASWLAWQPSSRGLLFTEHVDGSSGIATVEVETGRVTTRWTGAETIAGEGGAFGLSLSRDQKTTALVRHAFDRPPEVWAGPVNAWTQRTRRNAGHSASWGESRSLHWQSDRWQIQGWLVYPRDYDPKRRYPMVVSVHGGPASAKRSGWPGTMFDFTVLSADGYFVFFPNPRGSFGQGLAFTRANVRDFGHGDLRDILAGVDEVVRTLPIDEKRLGVVGWSYGGYMTMWAVTQTGRFRAAVAGAGIANWQSYYGQNGIDQWLLPYFGASVYDDPAAYARCSPIEFIKRVQTPTLVLVGERDLECPPPQSYEFWRALQRLKVPTQLVVYAGEGHRIGRPEHRRDILRRSAAWLGQRLEPHKGADDGPSKSLNLPQKKPR